MVFRLDWSNSGCFTEQVKIIDIVIMLSAFEIITVPLEVISDGYKESSLEVIASFRLIYWNRPKRKPLGVPSAG